MGAGVTGGGIMGYGLENVGDPEPIPKHQLDPKI